MKNVLLSQRIHLATTLHLLHSYVWSNVNLFLKWWRKDRWQLKFSFCGGQILRMSWTEKRSNFESIESSRCTAYSTENNLWKAAWFLWSRNEKKCLAESSGDEWKTREKESAWMIKTEVSGQLVYMLERWSEPNTAHQSHRRQIAQSLT